MTDKKFGYRVVLGCSKEKCAIGRVNCRSLTLDTISQSNFGATSIEEGLYA